MRRDPWLLSTVLLLVLSGCGSSSEQSGGPESGLQAVRAADGTIIDDRSLCAQLDQNKEREVGETAGPGAIQPNVRRVWQVFGTGADRRKVLVCREIDTNLDGVKDVVRTYNDEGQSKEERADTNFDGKLDTWIYFAKGRLAEVRLDHNFDGEPDEWKNYVEGKLIRIKRDTNFDTKPDVWEMYQKGRLVRMGVDIDHDSRVDRWDHDTEWRRRLDAAERKREEAEADKKKREAGGDEAEGDEAEGDEAEGEGNG